MILSLINRLNLVDKFIILKMQALRSRVSRLTTQNVVFLECDIQEKMRPLIKNFETVSHNA